MATSDWWCSPAEIADPLEEFYGGPVGIDPCSNDRSIIRAVVALTYGGLVRSWRTAKRTGYQNDPYSQAGAWTDKMLRELRYGNLREHVRLSMFTPSTKWWVNMCATPRCNPRILALKRISFLDPFADEAGQKRDSCRFELALTYFGPRPERFTKVFAHLTRWTTWGRT
jgi:hypothetical protein